MANVDNPKGFWPTRHLKGGEIRTNRYVLTASQTVYPGDVLKAVTAGSVEIATAGIGSTAIGIAAEYKVAPATGTTYIQVWDDPDIVFKVQSQTGDTPAITEMFTSGDHLATTGDSTIKMSRQELKIDGNAQFFIIGLVPDENNAWGEHADLEVIFAEHALISRTTVS